MALVSLSNGTLFVDELVRRRRESGGIGDTGALATISRLGGGGGGDDNFL